MDFFERQDKARRNTKWLVVYFVMAVVCIIASVYLACLVIFAGVSANQPRHRRVQLEAERGSSIQLWNPDIFSYAVLGTLAVVFCGSAWRLSSLSAGGSAVATSMGGRLVNPNTDDPDEQKLRNVVEEMALASGVPVPQIYVMDEEEGINAFAAGHTPSDAAIGVTRGCMKLLTRDELQGVIGHEFSHILNGDMRLNLRLMGIIFGILCLTIIGRILIRTRGRKNPLPLLGLALIIIGWVGVFFGHLIQAAVSRQREFLADASAVQFTRNPAGLAGALQKIGGLAAGSRVENGHAAEASHMFFGSVESSFLSAFSTHPPLEQRIRAIDPNWDGKFRMVSAGSIRSVGPSRIESEGGLRRAASGFAPPVIRAPSVLPNLGQPTPLHLRYAEELRNSFPETIRAAAREPIGAMALIYAMLLSDEPALRESQLQQLAQLAGAKVQERVIALGPEVANVATRARLPLADLAIAGLRAMTPAEFAQFSRALKWLIESDRQIDLLEYVLQKIVRRHLAPQFEQARPPVVQYYTLRPLMPDCAVLLSALAQVGSGDPAETERAFRKGVPYLRATDEIPLLPRAECGLGQVDAALNRLALAVPQIKKNLLEAAVQIVGADGVIQERESEMLRAIADTLDCPLPPFVTAE
ncbi:MAG TPA: M48 family metallopeptidase [Verrucomicrobiae bacterium]